MRELVGRGCYLPKVTADNSRPRITKNQPGSHPPSSRTSYLNKQLKMRRDQCSNLGSEGGGAGKKEVLKKGGIIVRGVGSRSARRNAHGAKGKRKSQNQVKRGFFGGKGKARADEKLLSDPLAVTRGQASATPAEPSRLGFNARVSVSLPRHLWQRTIGPGEPVPLERRLILASETHLGPLPGRTKFAEVKDDV